MNIVLVDDNHAENLIVHQIINELNPACSLTIIRSASKAKAYFSMFEKSEEIHKPDLIILDKNLGTIITGIDLLVELKKHEILRKIPVVMLTMYPDEFDKEVCYNLGLDKYYLKPQSLDEYEAILKDMMLLAEGKTLSNSMD